jgi:hypothetical protein
MKGIGRAISHVHWSSQPATTEVHCPGLLLAASDLETPRLQVQVLPAVTWQLLPLLLPVLVDAFEDNLKEYQVRVSL